MTIITKMLAISFNPRTRNEALTVQCFLSPFKSAGLGQFETAKANPGFRVLFVTSFPPALLWVYGLRFSDIGKSVGMMMGTTCTCHESNSGVEATARERGLSAVQRHGKQPEVHCSKETQPSSHEPKFLNRQTTPKNPSQKKNAQTHTHTDTKKINTITLNSKP